MNKVTTMKNAILTVMALLFCAQMACAEGMSNAKKPSLVGVWKDNGSLQQLIVKAAEEDEDEEYDGLFDNADAFLEFTDHRMLLKFDLAKNVEGIVIAIGFDLNYSYTRKGDVLETTLLDLDLRKFDFNLNEEMLAALEASGVTKEQLIGMFNTTVKPELEKEIKKSFDELKLDKLTIAKLTDKELELSDGKESMAFTKVK